MNDPVPLSKKKKGKKEAEAQDTDGIMEVGKQERGGSGESWQWMTFSMKAPYAVLGQGILLSIEGIYSSDFPEVIRSQMPVLITSRVPPVPHFTAGWAQAVGDPACSPGSPIKSSCPREHRHALLVLHWVGLWSSKKTMSRGVCVRTPGHPCAIVSIKSVPLVWWHFTHLLLFHVLMIDF